MFLILFLASLLRVSSPPAIQATVEAVIEGVTRMRRPRVWAGEERVIEAHTKTRLVGGTAPENKTRKNNDDDDGDGETKWGGAKREQKHTRVRAPRPDLVSAPSRMKVISGGACN